MKDRIKKTPIDVEIPKDIRDMIEKEKKEKEKEKLNKEFRDAVNKE